MTTTTRSQTTGTPATPPTGIAPTNHQGVLDWVAEVAALTTPQAVVWIDGSDSQWSTLAEKLIDAGTFTALADPPNSLHAASSDSDVARVEDRTFICSPTRGEAGPTNNWMDPVEMKATMTELYRGCMTGRTLYVIPFCMGPLDAPYPKLGVQITDSEYVVGSTRIMTRVGTGDLGSTPGVVGRNKQPRSGRPRNQEEPLSASACRDPADIATPATAVPGLPPVGGRSRTVGLPSFAARGVAPLGSPVHTAAR